MTRTTQKLFSTAEAARIFGLNESRLRYWAQTGFINPSGSKGGRRRYTFRDLVSIRAAKDLLDQGVPLQRVRKALKGLREALPEVEQPLGRIRVHAEGDDLVVSHERHNFEPSTGQLMLDFEVDSVGAQAAQVLELGSAQRTRSRHGGRVAGGKIHAGEGGPPDLKQPTSAYSWFLKGCRLDGDQEKLDQALASYQKALDLDPGLAAAHTNLGNLYYRLGEHSEALRCYEDACALDPDQPEARYNLANILEDEGDLDLAIAEYRRVLVLAPDFKDAHFNLALTLERAGSRVQAMHHWERFLELVEGSGEEQEWMEVALTHLEQLKSPQ